MSGDTSPTMSGGGRQGEAIEAITAMTMKIAKKLPKTRSIFF